MFLSHAETKGHREECKQTGLTKFPSVHHILLIHIPFSYHSYSVICGDSSLPGVSPLSNFFQAVKGESVS